LKKSGKEVCFETFAKGTGQETRASGVERGIGGAICVLCVFRVQKLIKMFYKYANLFSGLKPIGH